MKTSSLFRTCLIPLAALGLALQGPRHASAQKAGGDFLRNAPQIVRAFRPVVAKPSASTVRVRADGKDVALGTVTGANGWIVTKASQLSGTITCKLKDGREVPAAVVGVHEAFDLAMLKVEASGLTPITWEESKAATVGRWAASVGPGEDPVAIGVISVAARSFKAGDQPPKTLNTNSGFLGIGLEEGEGGARVTTVFPKSPAQLVGIKVGDVVTQVNKKKVLDSESLINAVGRHKPGAEITLHLIRGKEKLELKAKLAVRPATMLGNPQDRMGSALSNRRGGFPVILQHDTVLAPGDCGGPLVDLEGKAVGINISRAGRTETYAVPAEAVREILADLMSGNLPPPMKEE
jgi:serine protease Do